MKFGIYVYYPFDTLMKFSMLAEECGFDSVWMGDHIDGGGSWLEAWTTLGAVAMKTVRVKLGVGVTDPVRRPPAVLAQTATTLDIISNGRLILGIGAGEAMNVRPYGIPWDKPVSRMVETIKILKELWSEEEVSYSGRFYSLSKATLKPKPIQKPHPPVWISANSPRTLRLTGELGDGWLPMRISPELYKEELRRIKESAEKMGKCVGDVEAGVYVHSAISRDYDHEREPFRSIERRARYFLMLTPKRLEQLGYRVPTYEYDFSCYQPSPEVRKVLMEKAAEIPVEAVRKCGLYGTPKECIEKIEEYRRSGVEHLVISIINPVEKMGEAIKLFGEEVIPAFKR